MYAPTHAAGQLKQPTTIRSVDLGVFRFVTARARGKRVIIIIEHYGLTAVVALVRSLAGLFASGRHVNDSGLPASFLKHRMHPPIRSAGPFDRLALGRKREVHQQHAHYREVAFKCHVVAGRRSRHQKARPVV